MIRKCPMPTAILSLGPLVRTRLGLAAGAAGWRVAGAAAGAALGGPVGAVVGAAVGAGSGWARRQGV